MSTRKIIVLHDGIRTNPLSITGAPKVLQLLMPHLINLQYSFVDIPTLISSYDPSLTQQIGSYTLLGAYKSLIDNILNIELMWDINTIQCDSFQMRIMSDKMVSDDITIPFPSSLSMKEWFPTYEIEMDRNHYSKDIEVYVKINKDWEKLNFLEIE